jgi:predicted permease
MGGTRSDLRWVLRVLRRSPGFTLVAVLSLALGIGGNTAMFGVVRALLLTPLPVEAPDELVLVGWDHDGRPEIYQSGSTDYLDAETGARYRSNLSYPLYRALVESAPADTELFAFAFVRRASVALPGQPAFMAGGVLADGAYFSTLGVPMAMGRGIGPDDDRPGAPLVVVLNHAFWSRAFGADPEVLGRSLRINGQAAEIVGVTARSFKGLSLGGFFPQSDITLPLSAQPTALPNVGSDDPFFSEQLFWSRAMARVPRGPSRTGAEAQLQATLRNTASPLLASDGIMPGLRLIDGSQGAQSVRPQTARLLWLLLAVVGLVLLIACLNLASLMLARGVARQREMAVRRALGGGRRRLVQQAMTESLVLVAAGTLAGIALVYVSRGFLSGLLTGSLGAGAFGDLEMEAVLDPAVLVGTVALGVGATLLFGLFPALRLTALDPARWLKDRAAGAGSPRLTAGRVVIALQIGISVPLVLGAVLFLRTVSNLGAVELGFDPRGLVTFEVDPAFAGLDEEEHPRFYQELLAEISSVPGVEQATLLENIFLGGIVSNTSITVDDRRVTLYMNAVGPGAADVLGMTLLEGRMPGLQDVGDMPRVAAVNETAVREIFGGASPLGRTLSIPGREIQIVGVVKDTPYRNQRDPVPPTVFQSALQRLAWGGHNVVVRTNAPPGRLEPALREAIFRMHPDIPVPTLVTQTEIIRHTTARERVFTQLLTLFGGLALLLASIGLHGVTSYAVTRRTSEIGVRVAVGARPGQIIWMVLRQVVSLAGIGVVLGVPVALAAAPLVGSLLYGVAPTSAGSVTGAVAVLLGVAVLAGLVPALKAARMDAMEALRIE